MAKRGKGAQGEPLVRVEREDGSDEPEGGGGEGILTRLQEHALLFTAAAAATCVLVAAMGHHQLTGRGPVPFVPGWLHPGWVAFGVSLGALGGLVHEISQSRGKVLYFETREDGLYLGSIAGMVMGAVAGALAIHGVLLGATATGASGMQVALHPTFVGFEAFLAGLALKGVTEAAAGNMGERTSDGA